jgi:hypothetical protein
MTDYSTPIVITLINVIIIIDLIRAYHRFGKSDQNNKHNRDGFHITTLLLIANTFAFITGILYYFFPSWVPVIAILMLRFSDRYVMMFAYKVLYKSVE